MELEVEGAEGSDEAAVSKEDSFVDPVDGRGDGATYKDEEELLCEMVEVVELGGTTGVAGGERRGEVGPD